MRSIGTTGCRGVRSTLSRSARYAASAGRPSSSRTLSSQPHPHHLTGRASNTARNESADKDVPPWSQPSRSQRIKLGGTMGPHREGTGTIVGREAILKVLESYDPSAIRIATIGSHSALDVCDGAVEEGVPTLVVCEKGRASPYTRYFHAMRDKEGRAVRGMVDEAIVLSKFQDVLSEKMQDRLRKANVVFIPNRSFTSYCDLDGIERSFRVPLFGSRNLLRTEEREEERSYYWILEKAGLPAPEKIEDPKDIDGLVIVKLHHKVKKLERGFFTAASYKEYRAKSAALLKQGVISTRDFAKARIDWRFETSLDGHVRLPADQQLTLDEAQRIPEYVVVGHNSATLRESSLGEVFDIAERYVRATQEHFRPGIIGPFTLQTAVDKDLKFWVYDVAPRIGGGTNVHMSLGHPYGNSLWRRPMSTGRRIAMEIRRGVDSGRLDEIVT